MGLLQYVLYWLSNSMFAVKVKKKKERENGETDIRKREW